MYEVKLNPLPTGDIGNITGRCADSLTFSGGVTLTTQIQSGPYVECTPAVYFDGDVLTDIGVWISYTVYKYSWNGSEYVQSGTTNRTATAAYNATYNLTYYVLQPSGFSMFNTGTATTPITDAELLSNNIPSDNATLQIVRDYFDTPSVPTFTAKAYIKDLPMVTIQWDNIQNIPAGMYPASYYIRLKDLAIITQNLQR